MIYFEKSEKLVGIVLAMALFFCKMWWKNIIRKQCDSRWM